MEELGSEELNYDFNNNMFLLKNLLSNITRREQREKAVRWMRKLSNCNSNTAEMQLRNEFLYRLLQQTHQGELRAPFDEVPPNTPLLQLRHMLPLEEEPELTDTARWAERVMGRRPRPVLYSQSPDGGAFIASQPIPSCGVFCYMAVVSTKNKK